MESVSVCAFPVEDISVIFDVKVVSVRKGGCSVIASVVWSVDAEKGVECNVDVSVRNFVPVDNDSVIAVGCVDCSVIRSVGLPEDVLMVDCSVDVPVKTSILLEDKVSEISDGFVGCSVIRSVCVSEDAVKIDCKKDVPIATSVPVDAATVLVTSEGLAVWSFVRSVGMSVAVVYVE